MRKLSLKLETLQVDSFLTMEREDRRGTVRGHDDTEYPCGCIPQPPKDSDLCWTQDTCPFPCPGETEPLPS